MYKHHKEKHNKFNFSYIFKFMNGKKIYGQMATQGKREFNI